ncbi:16S rRNA (guanine(527)-N(7))-methyltransferase RsmG [Mycoplasma hyorhinis]|uniref:16S rRNA (guanine(527)-N(7))-methyltransferase RsmG n=1 Tax=Mesomycoplasma hyorhinis TaxID=2100 RepID=UPI00136AA0F0|nr:16S rRNA (guanine(527)-N(7))-methyltransferase RsmG [Mesomycoplasma hyorhinis]MXR38875.1 16S rRNA (guanine(527)-N(7))-methyltransferase RsmG [Mesomycoplasma hyorhinis]
MYFFKEKTRDLVNNEQIFSQLEKFVSLIEQKNKVMNLTGFTQDQLWKEGIYESIITLKQSIYLKNKKIALLDVGAGAGFPSIPFFIINSDIKLVIVEKLKKRCDFLQLVKQELNLDFEIINDLASNLQAKFDYITARAVGNLDFLFKITKKLQNSTTTSLWIKGPKIWDEVLEHKKVLKNYNYSIEEVKSDLDKQIFILKANKK